MGFLNALFGPAKPPEHYTYLLKQAWVELGQAQAGHDSAWGLSACSWQLDPARGTIRFSRADGGLQAEAPVQIIGSFLTTDGAWQWSWDNPAIDPALQLHARRVLDYGQEFGIGDLISPRLRASEDQGWQWAALAFKLNGAQGASRSPDGPSLVYVTFGAVTLAHPRA